MQMFSKYRNRIAISALAYNSTDGGFSKSIEGLLDAINSRQPEKYVVFVASDYRHMCSRYPRLAFVLVYIPKRGRILSEIILSPILALLFRVRLVHYETYASLPLLIPTSITAHDLFFLIQPGFEGPPTPKGRIISWYWRNVYVRALERASVIRAISRTTEDDLRRLTKAQHIVYVPQTLRTIDRPRPLAHSAKKVNGRRKLIAVGTCIPRKNLQALIACVRQSGKIDLRIAGGSGWGTWNGDSENVKYLGRISDEELVQEYENADYFVSASLYEGFCVPAFEAVSFGLLPVLSDIPVFREFFPPECIFDSKNCASLMQTIERLDRIDSAKVVSSIKEQHSAVFNRSLFAEYLEEYFLAKALRNSER